MKCLATVKTPVRRLAGLAAAFAVVTAHAAPGDLDASFGTNGKVTAGFAGTSNDFAQALARDGAGNVYLVGTSNTSGNFDFAIVKYDGAGQLVGSFGTGGKLLIDIGLGSSDNARAAVVAGSSLYVAGNTSSAGNQDVAIVKLDLNGQLVASFGTGGKRVIDIGPGRSDDAYAIAVDTGGNVFLAGGTLLGTLATSDMTAIKLDSSGNLVAGFSNGGIVTVDFAGNGDTAYAMQLDASGNVHIAGAARSPDGNARDMAVVKLDSNGNLVNGFGTGGKATVDFATIDNCLALARDGAGNLFLAGSTDIPPGHTLMAVAKLDASGALAGNFGNAGKKTLDLAGSTSSNITGIALDADGNLYVAGTGGYPSPAFNDLVVAALDAHGDLVGSFANLGVRRVDFANNNDTGTAVLLNGSGHLYAVGYASISGAGLDMAAARVLTALPNVVFANGFDP